MKEITINSWGELQKNITKIVISLNRDENLKLAAASNPIYALEELGYKIKYEILGQVEDKIRFKTKKVAKLSKLRQSIHKLAGKKFNIRSQAELNTLLFEDLKLEVYDDNGCLIKKNISARRQKGDKKDDLIIYKGLHPIIKKLLKFRKLDASVAGFCGKDIYQKIREGGYGKKSNIKLNVKLKNKK